MLKINYFLSHHCPLIAWLTHILFLTGLKCFLWWSATEKTTETLLKTDGFKWPAVSIGASLHPCLKLTHLSIRRFFSAFSDLQGKAKEGEVDYGEMRWVNWVGACYYKLLPMLLISYSRRAVLPPQMKAAVVSDREWPWPATPALSSSPYLSSSLFSPIFLLISPFSFSIHLYLWFCPFISCLLPFSVLLPLSPYSLLFIPILSSLKMQPNC